jgi:hypothetical protein
MLSVKELRDLIKGKRDGAANALGGLSGAAVAAKKKRKKALEDAAK